MPDAPDSSLNRPRWLQDPLATRSGRLTAFFILYVTEGIPLGFTATIRPTFHPSSSSSGASVSWTTSAPMRWYVYPRTGSQLPLHRCL
jgi:hypothetical protein